MVGVAQLFGEDPTRDRNGHVSRLLPDLGKGLVARPGNVTLGPLLGRFGLTLGQLDDLLGRQLGILPRLVQQCPHFVGGPGHLLAVLGEQ